MQPRANVRCEENAAIRVHAPEMEGKSQAQATHMRRKVRR
jgi:hypothetical protein